MLWKAAGRGESGGIQAQGETLIMGGMKRVKALSSGAEWGSVSRLSHTPTCSMLLKLHKLPHNYPGGENAEGGQAGEKGERVKGDRGEPLAEQTVIRRWRNQLQMLAFRFSGTR